MQQWKGQRTSVRTWSELFVMKWRRGELMCAVSSVKNEMAEIISQKAVDRIRQAKTTWRSTLRYLHDCWSHCGSAVKESEEQIRAMTCHMHKCDRERQAAWLITQTEIHHESSLGQAQVYITVRMMRFAYRECIHWSAKHDMRSFWKKEIDEVKNCKSN